MAELREVFLTLLFAKGSNMAPENEKGFSVVVEGAPADVRIVNGTDAEPGQFPFQVSTATWLSIQDKVPSVRPLRWLCYSLHGNPCWTRTPRAE